MAYFGYGPCISCRKNFTFNPDKVPSVRMNGVKEPVCLECVNRANPIRVAKGLEPIHVLPGAYDPQPEETDTDYLPDEGYGV